MQSLEVDPTTPIAGIEPVYFYILATVGSGVAGYMVGPPLGAAAWRFYNRKWAKALQEMDTRCVLLLFRPLYSMRLFTLRCLC